MQRVPHELKPRVKQIEEDRNKALDVIENALGALGEHPDSDINIATRISEIRDEGRGHFHTVTKMGVELASARGMIRRLLDWGLEDPHDPARDSEKVFLVTSAEAEAAGAVLSAPLLRRALRDRNALLAALDINPSVNTPETLDWVADRFVHVHGVDPNTDYVLSLRGRARAMRSAMALCDEPWPEAATVAVSRNRPEWTDNPNG